MGEPKRVLWLAKGLGRGGAETLLVSLARTMDASRVSLQVGYVLPHKDALVEDLRHAGARVVCLGGHVPGGWLLGLFRLLHTRRFDVIHTHSPVVASAARLLAPRGSVLVHTEHNVWARYRRLTRWANAVTLSRNRLVWAVSQGVASSIKSGLLRRRHPPVEVLLHGVDPALFHTGPEARATGLALLGFAEGPFTIATVGNLTRKKNHEALIHAFARHLQKHPSSRLVVVGGGPEEAHLRALVNRLRMESQVTLTGSRDDVPSLLAGFDLFVLSSSYEGLSIALVEALGAGLPVVATRVGGIPEVVQHDREGLLVPAADVGALQRAFDRMCSDEGLRTRFSANARIRAANFGIQRAADIIAERYEELASRAGSEMAAT